MNRCQDCNGYNPRHPVEPEMGGYCFVVGGYVQAFTPAPFCFILKGGDPDGLQEQGQETTEENKLASIVVLM